MLSCFAQADNVYKRGQSKSKATIFYIDLRTPGRYEKFYNKVKADANVSFVKGKVARLKKIPRQEMLSLPSKIHFPERNSMKN